MTLQELAEQIASNSKQVELATVMSLIAEPMIIRLQALARPNVIRLSNEGA